VLEARTTKSGRNLFKVRNVWKSELPWSGTFSKGSPSWTMELAAELSHRLDDEEHDYIWMTEEEFAHSFASITICKVSNDDETLRLKGEFVKGFNRQNQRFEDKSVRSKYQYEI